MMRNRKPEGYSNPVRLLHELHVKPERYWIQRGEKQALSLFHQMAQRVPAYKDFLKKHHIDHTKIVSIKDFTNVPLIDKVNYLRVYPRHMLCWDGKFQEQNWTISTTSGSTGVPYYFPREHYQDMQYALTAELYLRTNFHVDKKSTLYIVAFPMGAWIGGVFTYEALQLVARRGYSLSVITPGINKLEIINAVKNLGHDFDQIIIGSYAPFLKDFIDDGIRNGLRWSSYNLNFIFSAECVNETFKDYLIKKTGIKNVYMQTLNHYGTVDLGTMSHETPLTVMLRRMAVKNKKLYATLFSEIDKLPTLTQYNPVHFYFEDLKGNLACSSYSGLPLVRYDLKDHGGILSFDLTVDTWKKQGITIRGEMKKLGIEQTLWNLPLVYVYERSDLSVSFYGFQIYPETIRKALQHQSIEDMVTGKFTMHVYYGKEGNQIFEINIELKADVSADSKLTYMISRLIISRLKEENSEYRRTSEVYPDETIPKVVFWPYEDVTYFRPGVKQKWIKK